MAKELSLTGASTGLTVYALVRDTTGGVYTGSAFETQVEANLSTYKRTLAENGTTGCYFADMPSVAAGRYQVEYRRQSGGSPAWTDAVLATEWLDWSGTAHVGTGTASAAAIADAVWDEARSGHTTSGSFGEALQTKDGDITSATSTTVTLPSPYNTSAYQGRQIVCAGQVRVLQSLSTGIWTLDASWTAPANGTAFLLGFKSGGATAADVWTYTSRVITSVAGFVQVDPTQTGWTVRDISGVADSALTHSDLLVGAMAGGNVGRRSLPAGSTTLTVKTPGSGTTVSTRTADSSTAPTAFN